MSVNPTQSSRFTRLDQSTREDWQSIAGEFRQLAAGLPDRILAHLKLLDGEFGGFPVDRYTTRCRPPR